MLARCSRQKLQRRPTRLQPAFDQLRLPWLCPALYGAPRPRQQGRPTTSAADRRPQPSPSALGRPGRPPPVPTAPAQHGRGLAYAAMPEPAVFDDDLNLPWGEAPSGPSILPGAFPSKSPPPSHGFRLADLPPFDPAQTVQLSDSLQAAPRHWKTEYGIGGNVTEMFQIFEACLQTGELAKAAAAVSRLSDVLHASAPELRAAHNAYLGALVARLAAARGRDRACARALHAWFHLHMLKAGYRRKIWWANRREPVRPDAVTIALLVRGSLLGPDEHHKGRAIRRYLRHARRFGIFDEARVAVLAQVSDYDAGRLATYDPESFYSPQEVPEEEVPAEAPEETPEEAWAAHEALDDPDAPRQPALNVRSQAQKGLGLVALQKSLAALTEVKPLYEDESLHERQERLEQSVIASALERWRQEHEEMQRGVATNNSLQSKPVGALMWSWHEALLPLIREELRLIKIHLRKANTTRRRQGLSSEHTSQHQRYQEADRTIYGPFMRFISPEKLSAVTILTCIQHMVTGFRERAFMPSTHIIKAVGRAVEDESRAEILNLRKECGLTRKLPSVERVKRLTRLVRRDRRNSMSDAAKRALANMKSQPAAVPRDDDNWSQSIVAKLGALLVSQLLQAAKIDVRLAKEDGGSAFEQRPAFSWGNQYVGGRQLGVLSMNPGLIEKLHREPVGSVIAKHLPMIAEPRPWTGFSEGGFLAQNIHVVRALPEHRQTRDYLKVASRSGDLDQLYAGLNVLGRTKWQVNRRVFGVMLDVWNSGEALASIPAANPQVQYPDPPPADADKAAWKEYNAQVKRLDDVLTGMHSNRCFCNFQMEVAKAFLHETFYLPHNLDFRGRAYPIPPYFNHMGADNCRGLMLFGEGKALGPDGLRWLQIHLANVYGFDKASLDERQQWSIDRMEEVWDSVKNPLEGRRWWLKAEDPWQCLATCFELTSALSLPDPTAYVSHLPVHQDGTCNGLQHYAALGGDKLGAQQVNLVPGPRPSDIYTAVANMVAEEVAEEAANGDELAQKLDGKIKRKVVKQTVMTNVYGVTVAGAREQVGRQLKDLYPDLFPDDPKGYVLASLYVAKKIFASLSRMFNGANAIQTWLGQCGARVSTALTAEQIQTLAAHAAAAADPEAPKKLSAAQKKAAKAGGGPAASDPAAATATRYRLTPVNYRNVADEFARFRSTIIWTTPLRLPVVQPYRKSAVRRVATHLSLVSLMEPSTADPVDKRKQLQGFAPNFIHSLDATHMLLTALACEGQGLAFASVHDSFWTHAADVAPMNVALRDAFVRMHAEDVMGRLAAEFRARYRGAMYLAAVPRATPLGARIVRLRAEAARAQQLRRRRRRTPATDDAAVGAGEGASLPAPAPLTGRPAKTLEAERQLADLLVEQRRLKLLASESEAERAEGRAMRTAGALWAEADRDTDLIMPSPPEKVAAAAVDAGVEAEVESEEAESDAGSAAEGGADVDAEARPDGVTGEPAVASEGATPQQQGETATPDPPLPAWAPLGLTKNGRAKRAPKKKPAVPTVWLWLPLEFPEVPTKGNFDVSRVRDSTYFFS